MNEKNKNEIWYGDTVKMSKKLGVEQPNIQDL